MIIKEIKSVSIAIIVWAILALFAIALLANTILNIDGSRQHVRESYQKGVKTLVQSAVSVIRYYQSQSEIGNLSEEEARASALETISNMRFDGGNYIFVGNREGKQIATGVPSLLGKNIWTFKIARENILSERCTAFRKVVVDSLIINGKTRTNRR